MGPRPTMTCIRIIMLSLGDIINKQMTWILRGYINTVFKKYGKIVTTLVKFSDTLRNPVRFSITCTLTCFCIFSKVRSFCREFSSLACRTVQSTRLYTERSTCGRRKNSHDTVTGMYTSIKTVKSNIYTCLDAELSPNQICLVASNITSSNGALIKVNDLNK